jgi:small multidrug resistance family-3 protein
MPVRARRSQAEADDAANTVHVALLSASRYPESAKREHPMKLINVLPILAFLVVATGLEVSGDAIVRKALFGHAGLARVGLFLLGAALLAGYGTFLNLAPLEFGQVVGLYIATLFVMWQILTFVFFRTLPTTPILLGGSLIVIGGLIVSFWKQAS